MGNLVDNAIRHGQGTVRIEAVQTASGAELHVHDEGPGLPHTFVPRAFHRFSQADEAHAAGGAGLGLAIVHSIAVAHGGSAHVLAGPKPADICITLPAAPDA